MQPPASIMYGLKIIQGSHVVQVFNAECVNYFLIEQMKVVHFTFFIYFNLICSYRSQDEKGDKKKTSTQLDTEEPWKNL